MLNSFYVVFTIKLFAWEIMFTLVTKRSNSILSCSTRRCGFATLNRQLSQLPGQQQTPPLSHQQTNNQDTYWKKIPQWKDISTDEFLSYRWQVSLTQI